MCGIHGFNYQDPEALRRMHATTHHRGPDGEGFFESPVLSLAHNRLAIIDVSPAGKQPMFSPDGRWVLVFNGEIYNYRELRQELESLGEKFFSSSDTEVLLHAFARWREGCLTKLQGIFAFAIWDMGEQRLWLVRDAMGVKPLYYVWNGKRLVFSSEIKAILPCGISREMDETAFHQYFRLLYVPSPRTMFRHVNKLPAGQVALFEHGSLQLFPWSCWKESEVLTDLNAAKAMIRERISQAVKRQLVSDRPLGVFLSGGIDSTTVLAAMRQHQRGIIKTFSVAYESSAQQEKYNADAKAAELSAQFFAAEHETFLVNPQNALACLEKTIWHMDEPIANHVQTSTYLLAHLAKPTITVALGGDGGDELFGGYPRYWWSSWIDAFRQWPIPWKSAKLAKIAHRFGRAAIWEKFCSTPGLERWLVFAKQKEALVRRVLKSEPSYVLFDDVLPMECRRPWQDPTNQLMACDLATWLPEESLMRTDKMTMAHGLEERVPLLDTELVSLAFRLPSSWKVDRHDRGKRIFVDAVRDWLPPHVQEQEKRAWMSPASKWLRGPWLPWAREVLSPQYCSGTASFFDFAAIQQLLDDHTALRIYALPQLWSILTFQMWFRIFQET